MLRRLELQDILQGWLMLLRLHSQGFLPQQEAGDAFVACLLAAGC